MSPRPIRNCYWVVPGKFLAGEYPRDKDDKTSREKINALVHSGVTRFIDLTEENEGLSPYAGLIGKAMHQRFPIRDISIPNSKGEVLAVLDAIDLHLNQKQMVYVHCWGGVGRTGVIVGCWLARHGLGGAAALDQLHVLWKQCPKSAYRRSPETREQENYILKWENGL